MLKDFIEANSLQARIIPARVNKEDGAVCRLFVSDSGKAFLTINRVHNKLDFEKLKKAILEICNEEFHEAGPVEAERITGYNQKFLPPISIYGVHLLLDRKASECSELYFFTANEETLQIPTKEIIEMNEDYSIVDITMD